jgi:predicted transposase/invertase (TIGR01784 family)
MYRFLDPKNDFAFKQLFGVEKNKAILIRFLNDMFVGVHDKIEDVEFLKLSQDPEIASLRQSIVDVLCSDVNGRQFIIEMQRANDTSFIKRAVAYACRAYLNQRTKSDEKISGKSKNYGDMKPVIFFAILERALFKNKREYLSHHKVSDICTGENDIRGLSFSFLELSKFEKKFDELETNIEKWAYFFKNATTTEPQELEQIRKQDMIIGEAYDALSAAAFTPEQLLDYERYAMKEDEIATCISDAEKKGEERGEARGVEKGKREAALSMLANNLPMNIISKCTGLSEEEIRELQ